MKDTKIQKFDELSDDIDSKDLEVDFEKVKSGEIEIESVIDVFMDPKDIKENYVGLNYDLTKKELKRGDTFYITAMIRKKGSSFSSPASQAVIKVRIIDIYNGLSYLNRVINK